MNLCSLCSTTIFRSSYRPYHVPVEQLPRLAGVLTIEITRPPRQRRLLPCLRAPSNRIGPHPCASQWVIIPASLSGQQRQRFSFLARHMSEMKAIKAVIFSRQMITAHRLFTSCIITSTGVLVYSMGEAWILFSFL